MTAYTMTVSTDDLGLGVLVGCAVQIERKRAVAADQYPPVNVLYMMRMATDEFGKAVFTIKPDDSSTYHACTVWDQNGVPVYRGSFAMPPENSQLHSVTEAVIGATPQFQNKGVNIGTPLSSRILNFTGRGVSSAFADQTVTVTIDDRDYVDSVNSSRYNGGPLRLAHRGYSGHAIENTMSSFTRAVELGCDALELDVQISSDGIPVVIHDSTVDYSTTATGNVKDFTAAQLQAMTRDARYGAFYVNSRIPLFSEVIAFAKSKKIMLFPEIKGYRTQADIQLMVQAVIDAGYESMTKFQSFNLDDLTVARSFSSKVALGHTNGYDDYRTGAATLLSLGGPTPWIITSLYKAGLRPQYIAELQAMGIKVGAYTAYLASEFAQAEALGVDGVVCDRCFRAN